MSPLRIDDEIIWRENTTEAYMKRMKEFCTVPGECFVTADYATNNISGHVSYNQYKNKPGDEMANFYRLYFEIAYLRWLKDRGAKTVPIDINGKYQLRELQLLKVFDYFPPLAINRTNDFVVKALKWGESETSFICTLEFLQLIPAWSDHSGSKFFD